MFDVCLHCGCVSAECLCEQPSRTWAEARSAHRQRVQLERVRVAERRYPELVELIRRVAAQTHEINVRRGRVAS